MAEPNTPAFSAGKGARPGRCGGSDFWNLLEPSMSHTSNRSWNGQALQEAAVRQEGAQGQGVCGRNEGRVEMSLLGQPSVGLRASSRLL